MQYCKIMYLGCAYGQWWGGDGARAQLRPAGDRPQVLLPQDQGIQGVAFDHFYLHKSSFESKEGGMVSGSNKNQIRE